MSAWLLAGDHEDATLRTQCCLAGNVQLATLVCQQAAFGHSKPLGILGCMPAIPLAVLL